MHDRSSIRFDPFPIQFRRIGELATVARLRNSSRFRAAEAPLEHDDRGLSTLIVLSASLLFSTFQLHGFECSYRVIGEWCYFCVGLGRKLGHAGTGVHGRYEEAVGGKGHVLPCER